MTTRSFAAITIFLIALLSGSVARAQFLGIGRRAASGEAPPKAVLVVLLGRASQRNYLAANRPDLLPIFNHDAAQVNRCTVKDWSEHFKFCPVYFFRDSMSAKVREGDWEGVLLDSALRPVANPVLQPGDKNFYIAYYGTPIPQPDSVRPRNINNAGQNMEHDGDDATALLREMLIVNDATFRMLPSSGPRTNYVRNLRPDNMSGGEYRIYRRALTYNASRWYIDYAPVAYSYDATLRRYFRQRKNDAR